MEKQKYETPITELIGFETEDVITTSNELPFEPYNNMEEPNINE